MMHCALWLSSMTHPIHAWPEPVIMASNSDSYFRHEIGISHDVQRIDWLIDWVWYRYFIWCSKEWLIECCLMFKGQNVASMPESSELQFSCYYPNCILLRTVGWSLKLPQKFQTLEVVSSTKERMIGKISDQSGKRPRRLLELSWKMRRMSILDILSAPPPSILNTGSIKKEYMASP